MYRRQFLSATGVSLALAGCIGSDDSVQDSDGDGVIDSQDYAPNDPAVESKSDLQDTSQPFDYSAETTQEPTTTETDWFEELEESDKTTVAEALPDPVIQKLVSSEPKLVSVDHTAQSGPDTFTATIQNEGDNGQVHVSLFWGDDADEDNPFLAVQDKSVFFNSGERRTVSLRADPPADVEEYEIRVRTATRGAEIMNRGASGNVKVELKGTSEIPLSSQTLYIGADSTETVTFDGERSLFGDEWEIEVSPADE